MILETFHFREVFILLIIVAVVGYYMNLVIKYYKKKSKEETPIEEDPNTENTTEGKINQQKPANKKSKRNYKVTFGVIIIILIGLTLPFHYLPEHGKVLMKANLTFKNTIVMNSDIERIVNQYNNASFMQQAQMRQYPFIQTLMESGVLFDRK